MKWIETHAAFVFGRVLGVIAILVVARLLSNTLERAIERMLANGNVKASGALKGFATSTTRKLVILAGFLGALHFVGVNVTAMVAGLGVTGLVIGFALKDTLANFASGVMVLLYQPFDVGDQIKVAGQEGEVVSVTLNATLLNTPDNRRIIIPNGKVWGDAVINGSVLGTRRAEVLLSLGPTEELARAMQVAAQAAATEPLALATPKVEAVVNAIAAAGATQLAVRAFVKPNDLLPAQANLGVVVRQALVKGGFTVL
jgi:small conductance mechanosensitive channel